MAASSLAPRTAQRYEYIWFRVRTWLRDNGHPVSLPISAALYQEFALFVSSDPNMERPRATLKLLSAAMAWLHRLYDMPNPAASAYSRQVTRGLVHLRTQRPVQHRPPAPHGALARLYAESDSETMSLSELRGKAIALFTLATALRPDSVAKLTVRDISYTSTGMSVSVWRSKADRDLDGRLTFVPNHPNLNLCPVRTVRTYIARSRVPTAAATWPTFLRVEDHKVARDDAPLALTPNRVSTIITEVMRRAAPGSNITGGGLRSGAATAAVNSGVPIEVMMQHGGWRSRAIFDECYAHWSTPANLTALLIGERPIQQPDGNGSNSDTPSDDSP